MQKFMTGHYDAILMDIQMPVMDGYEAVAEIRRLEQSDHRRPTPIIALTASAHDEAVRRSLKMGCDAHVTKPVKRSTLLETIRDAVEPAPQSAPSAAEAAGNGAGGAAALGSEQPIVVQIDPGSRATSSRVSSPAKARTLALSWPRRNTTTPRRLCGWATR